MKISTFGYGRNAGEFVHYEDALENWFGYPHFDARDILSTGRMMRREVENGTVEMIVVATRSISGVPKPVYLAIEFSREDVDQIKSFETDEPEDRDADDPIPSA